MRTWQLQEAKNKFSEVVDGAINEGPQVVSYAEYRKILAGDQKLSDFFGQSPLAGVDLDLERDKSPVRDDISL